MKKLIALLMILGITSCGVYRPSVKDLEKNGFQERKVSNLKRKLTNLKDADFYRKELADLVFKEIHYYPRQNAWVIYGTWKDSEVGSTFLFYTPNRKSYKSLMDEIKSMSNPNTQKNVERKRKRAD